MPRVLNPKVDAEFDNQFQPEALATARVGRGRSRTPSLTLRVGIPGTSDEPQALRDILPWVLVQRGIRVSA